jgi:hypothetical protein
VDGGKQKAVSPQPKAHTPSPSQEGNKYTKSEMVGITLQKVSDLLGLKCQLLMSWLQMKDPPVFRMLVLDIDFDRKFRNVNKKDLGIMLHDYLGEWRKLKDEFDFI